MNCAVGCHVNFILSERAHAVASHMKKLFGVGCTGYRPTKINFNNFRVYVSMGGNKEQGLYRSVDVSTCHTRYKAYTDLKMFQRGTQGTSFIPF
jgi:hypothetical protein